MTSPARTIDRREAAVTAALAGAVLIVLGYASGIGLRAQSAVAAAPPQPQTSAPAPSALSPEPEAVMPPMPAVAVPAAPMVMPATTPPAATPTPSPSTPEPSATPTPTPAPTPEASCAPGLVQSLVGDLPLLGSASTVVGGLLGSVPLLTTPGSDATTAENPLTCTIGALVGPSCCGDVAARSDSGDTR